MSVFLGRTPGRDHLLVGLTASTVVLRAGALAISYAAQFVPLVLIHGDSEPEGFTYPDGTVPGASTAYAFGLSPFGLKLELPVVQPVALYFATSAGGLVFFREYPIPGAGKVAFTLEAGLGVDIALNPRHWLQLGFKYHHLSNGNFAEINPGVDARVWYVGNCWSTHLRR